MVRLQIGANWYCLSCEVIAEVEQKRKRLGVPRGKSVRLALVYDGKLASSVEAEGFFDSIVNAKNLCLNDRMFELKAVRHVAEDLRWILRITWMISRLGGARLRMSIRIWQVNKENYTKR